MKKLIFRGPVQTQSGYGVHARMLLKSLDESGKFDITVMSVPWGATPLIYENTPEMSRIKELAVKFNPTIPMDFDVSVQVTIPNEFMKLAKKNVCVTAGIETDRVSKMWQDKTNEFADVLVVPSVHSARSFTTGIYGSEKGPEQVLLRKPLYVLPEWVDTSVFNTNDTESNIDLADMPAFNFITVGLGMDKEDGADRKNISLLVKWFCEQFRDNKEVGLVMKTSICNYSEVDFKNMRMRISSIKAQTGCGQYPKIKLIHGRLANEELAALYKHPKVKALITTTHGEGYGLPIIEAAACGLPVIATNWSGHLDFLSIKGKNKFVPINYTLEEIPQSSVWEGVLDKGTKWAVPIESDVKMKMAKVMLSYAKPKEWATELAVHIANTFNDTIGKTFAADVYKIANNEPTQLTKNILVHTSPRYDRLQDVTLTIVSDVKISESSLALQKSLEQLAFGDVIFCTSKTNEVKEKNVKLMHVDKMNSISDYDNFICKELHKYVTTSHVLNIQWDGYVLNGSAWNEKFLQFDYVGAPWPWDQTGMNAGFALISKKLLAELATGDYESSPFDINVTKKYRKRLEDKGFKFADPETAASFSAENVPYTGQLGWHGENTFAGERLS